MGMLLRRLMVVAAVETTRSNRRSQSLCGPSLPFQCFMRVHLLFLLLRVLREEKIVRWFYSAMSLIRERKCM
jgi:hypothetical protein